jgi:hypothetical protein
VTPDSSSKTRPHRGRLQFFNRLLRDLSVLPREGFAIATGVPNEPPAANPLAWEYPL